MLDQLQLALIGSISGKRQLQDTKSRAKSIAFWHWSDLIFKAHYFLKFTQVYSRPKNFYWTDYCINEGPVKCAIVCHKSWVILMITFTIFITTKMLNWRRFWLPFYFQFLSIVIMFFHIFNMYRCFVFKNCIKFPTKSSPISNQFVFWTKAGYTRGVQLVFFCISAISRLYLFLSIVTKYTVQSVNC